MTIGRLTAMLIMASAAATSARGQDLTKFTLNGAEEPETKAWTEPASIAFTSNDGAKDSWAVNLVGKVEGQASPNSTTKLFARAALEKNTQVKKEVETYGFAAGAKFDWDNADHGPGSPRVDVNAWYLFGEASLGVTDKAVFPDPKAVCTATPPPAECGKQRETSLRALLALQPFRSSWETTFYYADASHTVLDGPNWTRSFAPVLTLFHDEVLDAKTNASGVRPDGGVTGAKLVLSGAISPKFTDYRLVLSAKLQHVEAFDRSSLRKEGFPKSASLVKLAADYEFGPRSFERGSGWVPALGVAYTEGDDPLAGKSDLDNVVIAFKITYRSE